MDTSRQMYSSRDELESISRIQDVGHRARRPLAATNRGCCWSCNAQICCSYLMALISSSLVVFGVYLAISKWNKSWLVISASGLILTFFGSCLYYCGTKALAASMYQNNDSESDSENDLNNLDEVTFPSHRRTRRQNKQKRSKYQNRKENFDPNSRSLSQLSLNMIPQYFSPADTSFIRHNLGQSDTMSTIATSHGGNPNNGQIFSVNGQSYLILPLSGDSVLPPSATNTTAGHIHIHNTSSSSPATIDTLVPPTPNDNNSQLALKMEEDCQADLEARKQNMAHILSHCLNGQSSSSSGTDSSSSIFGPSKIIGKSINRGISCPSSSSGSNYVSNIFDHNPLSRRPEQGQDPSVPKRSSSLKSGSRTFDQVSEPETSNFFVSFVPSIDGKVNCGSNVQSRELEHCSKSRPPLLRTMSDDASNRNKKKMKVSNCVQSINHQRRTFSPLIDLSHIDLSVQEPIVSSSNNGRSSNNGQSCNNGQSSNNVQELFSEQEHSMFAVHHDTIDGLEDEDQVLELLEDETSCFSPPPSYEQVVEMTSRSRNDLNVTSRNEIETQIVPNVDILDMKVSTSNNSATGAIHNQNTNSCSTIENQ